jgi:hypothetical protein
MQAAEQNEQEMEWLLQGGFPMSKRKDGRVLMAALTSRKPKNPGRKIPAHLPPRPRAQWGRPFTARRRSPPAPWLTASRGFPESCCDVRRE